MLCGVCVGLVLFVVLGYALPQAAATLLPVQDLKKKYDAEWALVTGASSGIGRALAARLASQGLSVVLVAIDEPLLDTAHKELSEEYPDVRFMRVGVNLGAPGYLETIAAATEKIDVQCVFNNAGFIVAGFVHQTPLAKLAANVECNAVACVGITHLFLTRMTEKKLKGCVVFTSSAAAYMPGAFAAMYASTKAFVSTFAASIAAEVKSKGIDVLAWHPSPVASRFYDKTTAKIDLMEFFKKFSVPAEELPDEVFKCIGYCSWRDIGGVAIFFRLLGKLVDYNFMMVAFMNMAHIFPDYKRNDKDTKAN